MLPAKAEPTPSDPRARALLLAQPARSKSKRVRIGCGRFLRLIEEGEKTADARSAGQLPRLQPGEHFVGVSSERHLLLRVSAAATPADRTLWDLSVVAVRALPPCA